MSESGGTQNTITSPVGAAFVGQSSGQVAAGVAVAVIGAQAGRTNFLTGFDVTGSGATAGSVVDVTVAGLTGATLHYALVVPAGAGVACQPLSVSFVPPFPASGPNTAITVSCPSLGAGSTNSAVNVRGFRA